MRKTIEIDPTFDLTHWFLGQAYEDKGQLAEAIAQYEKATQLNPDPAVLASLARAYALAGRKEEARKILDNLTTESGQRYIPAYSLAVIHLSLGEKEEALRLLEKSYEDLAPFDTGVYGSIKIDRRLEPLRGDPRFQALVQSAILVTREELLHYSKLHQILTQGSAIQVRLFQKRADAAKWLGISLETLE